MSLFSSLSKSFGTAEEATSSPATSVVRSGSWQQQFEGRWKKIERKNFYEFLVSNGIPSVVAYLMKEADCGQIFDFDAKDDYRFRLKALGTPTMTLPWMKMGHSPDDAEIVEIVDPTGAPFHTKFWYDEKEKILRSWSKNTKNGVISLQTREIDTNGHLLLTHTAMKPDGSTISHSILLKKA